MPSEDRFVAALIADQFVSDFRWGREWRLGISVEGVPAETEDMRSLKLKHKLERARLERALVVAMEVELVKLRSRSESW